MSSRIAQTDARSRIAWLKLFRVPNLATAGGEAVAGAALALAAACGRGAPRWSSEATAAGVAALVCGAAAEIMLYLAGLADNDLVDEAADRASGSDRPLATGDLSRRQVVAARAVCFAAAFAAVAFARPSAIAWVLWCAVAAAIVVYNRTKERFPRAGLLSMGACRSLSVAAGAALSPAWAATGAVAAALPWMVAGWTTYVAAITWLGAREECADGALPPGRFAPAAFCLVPAVGLWRSGLGATFAVPAAAGCAAAAVSWCRAVRPLGRAHGPGERGRAVGAAVGALLWMQSGFALAGAAGLAGEAPPLAVALAALCAGSWIFRFAARRLFPKITGS